MPRKSVRDWSDDPAADLLTCTGTPSQPGCGRGFAALAKHPRTGVRCGRDKCPHCGVRRAVPDALHATYTKWFGLVAKYTPEAAKNLGDYDAAFDLIHDAYIVALLRWVPARAAFSTFAVWHLRRAAAYARPTAQQQFERSVVITGPSEIEATPAVEISALIEQATPADMSRLLNVLPKRHRTVVAMKLGLPPHSRAHTHREIATDLGVSPQRSQQMYERAISTLQQSF
ncbi:hypothetical protein VT84_30785 [Gemmata sp. SH-PL17]|uniref:sigma-70 family RNA polymerase sigma factor n=1 Tax=Gemmata sp. SH-PL17 TaxID=1630693 RepID=UPI00078B4EC1|nr:sigma-70 family RNA polymerase sigma factor [Gemmata sp. SH-PL17]AMV28820.1 hypothetical protein VT84_30785 [Gemmata sp. SH-PL17]